MKKLLLVSLLATSALAGLTLAQSSPSTTPAAKAGEPSKTAALENLLIAQEKGTWEAVKRHDAAAFAAVCLDDCEEIWADGSVLPIKEILAQVPDTEIAEYKMEEEKVIFLNPETALVRYKIWAKTSYKGQGTPPQWAHATAVWVRKGDAWKAAFYQETALPKK
jgi:ketosteroid isomerase-like protein